MDNAQSLTQKAAVRDQTKNVLISWGLLAEDKVGVIHPTNAYIFLRGEDNFLSQIQCAMFKDETRTIFIDKRECKGALWQQIEGVFRFVLSNIHLGACLDGIYRNYIYELPPDSIRELIINAVMNCSFLQNTRFQVAIYDNRLEITSPGGLMPGVTIERMKEGYSMIRNRALAHAFLYMNLIEAWGSGIPRLMKAMRNYGLAELEFVDMGIALRINLYRGKAKTDQAIDKEKQLLKLISEQAKLSQSKMTAILGWKLSSVKYYIGKLQDKGIVERKESSQKGELQIVADVK
ncbi:ATP-binding protein [Amygdalobacter nucleatus]|uniref:ATP-binding protein n=1 Tax=Amygdalobacter nucleatus TaxID=3029274 RepID=UPI0027A641F6|nr:ATP-binding protein [Amygdalobacter nucleatus]WEG37301.1 ATP-binding protein [Amygdalobacter nucleatus]